MRAWRRSAARCAPPTTVITSYSIHYTKLYDGGGQDDVAARQHGARGIHVGFGNRGVDGNHHRAGEPYRAVRGLRLVGGIAVLVRIQQPLLGAVAPATTLGATRRGGGNSYNFV